MKGKMISWIAKRSVLKYLLKGKDLKLIQKDVKKMINWIEKRSVLKSLPMDRESKSKFALMCCICKGKINFFPHN